VDDLLQILKQFESKKIRRKSQHERIWEADNQGFFGSKQVEDFKAKFLDQVTQRYLPVYFYYGEPPDEAELQGKWREIEDSVFEISKPCPSAALMKWLYEGNWLATDSAKVEKIPDLIRGTADQAEAFMQNNRLRFFIDSFHDDAYWLMGLREELSKDAPQS
jgi:hypothetical protein